MPTLKLETSYASPFDAIKKTNEDGSEFWSARDLMPLLGYANWQQFERPIERAIKAATGQGAVPADHFVSDTLPSSNGPARRDYRLSRYAMFVVCIMCTGESSLTLAAKAYVAGLVAGEDLPYVRQEGVDGYLYVYATKSGLVKIGRSATPETRMRGHRKSAHDSGDPVVNSYISAGCSKSDVAEKMAHQGARDNGAVPVSGVEVFRGISFRHAVTVVKLAVAESSLM